MDNFSEKVSFIWAVADLLRGDFKQSEYGRVILPFVVLRRLDSVLADTKAAVLKCFEKNENTSDKIRHRLLLKAAKQPFYNTSRMSFPRALVTGDKGSAERELGTLLSDPNNIDANLLSYINSFSENARKILEFFRFDKQIERLKKANILYLVVQKFSTLRIHPDEVSNLEMGYIFEELIRRFSEQSNETAGEHFTPREVIRLMVDLLFLDDGEVLSQKAIVRTILDPACGTGGMLSVAEAYLQEFNKDASLEVFGQELNDESYATCTSDMLLKGHNAENIRFGNSFTHDQHQSSTFDYLISNPPFGVSWKKVQKQVTEEHEQLGMAGRFGAGLPRVNDGSLLFLLHMISKMKPVDKGGSRVAIVFNGSPLFTGSAGSGESEIRKWIIENDWLEAIVALPDQLFYNTGINTYIWVVTNRKSEERQGKVQLVNGVSFYEKMRKSLGNKRHLISDSDISEITRLYGDFRESKHVKIFNNKDFGFSRITVERPLKLNFQASKARIERIKSERAFINLATSKKRKDKAKAAAEIAAGEKEQAQILEMLDSLDESKLYKSRKEFEKDLKQAAKKAGYKLGASIKKAILNALCERDASAAVCRKKDGKAEPDSTLRDYENVPLTEDIDEYMEREVLPHVPDAWVDHEKTKIGYEIPFTRHFYEYTPPRPLAEIESEIRELEQEIQGMLGEVLG